MALQEIQTSHQTVIRRFAEACQADERVVAAFLGGSYAKGTADAYSDCPLEQGAMLKAAFVIVQFYRELAPPLAQAHGITYPTELERVMYNRLEK